MTGPLDLAAQLTLQIICFLQSDREAPCSAVRWSFVPWGGGEKTFGEAAARLTSVEKPVVIGALSHPGSVALWRPSAIDAGERPHIEYGLANQVAGLDEALSHFQVDSAGIVRFEGWGTHVDVPVPVLRRWLGEYAVTWGWRIGAPTDPTHQARLLVLHGSGRWSPGGTTNPASR